MSIQNKDFFKRLKSQSLTDSILPGLYASEIILISINHTGTTVVNSRTDKSLRVWKARPDKLIESNIIDQAHEKPVERISWHPKHENTFASVGRDSKVKIWMAQKGILEQEIEVEKWHTKEKTSCQFVNYSNDGQLLIVIDRDSTISILSVVENYKKLSEIKISQYIYDVQWFNFEHKYFAIALHDGTVPIYEVNEAGEPQIKTILKGHRSSITCLQIDPRGQYFTIGSNEGVISIYQCDNMILQKIITSVDEAISCVSISRDGTYLAVGYDRKEDIRIIDHATNQEMYVIPNSQNGKLVIPSITWFPNKTALICASNNCTTMNFMSRSDF